MTKACKKGIRRCFLPFGTARIQPFKALKMKIDEARYMEFGYGKNCPHQFWIRYASRH